MNRGRFATVVSNSPVFARVRRIVRPHKIKGRPVMPALTIVFRGLGRSRLFGTDGFVMGLLVSALCVAVFEIVGHVEGGENAEQRRAKGNSEDTR